VVQAVHSIVHAMIFSARMYSESKLAMNSLPPQNVSTWGLDSKGGAAGLCRMEMHMDQRPTMVVTRPSAVC
jgi:hypothetical protein